MHIRQFFSKGFWLWTSVISAWLAPSPKISWIRPCCWFLSPSCECHESTYTCILLSLVWKWNKNTIVNNLCIKDIARTIQCKYKELQKGGFFFMGVWTGTAGTAFAGPIIQRAYLNTSMLQIIILLLACKRFVFFTCEARCTVLHRLLLGLVLILLGWSEINFISQVIFISESLLQIKYWKTCFQTFLHMHKQGEDW